MSKDNNDKVEKAKLTLAFGDESKPFNGWVKLVKEERVPTEAPWRKGSLIKINNSPAPSKVPNNSVVMFLEHSLVKYRISTPTETVSETEDTEDEQGESVVIPCESQETDHLQHRITVLFHEKVVELYSQELGDDFGEVEK